MRIRRADIDGIGPEARGAFSQRAAAIAEHLSQRGLGSPRARVIAAHATRPERDTSRSADDLRPWWESRARDVGLEPRHLADVLDRVPRRPGPGPDPGLGEVVAEALGRRGPTATRRDVVRAWCGSLPEGAPAAAVEEAADRLLESMPATGAHADRVERGGVGERRHLVGRREIRRDTSVLARRELERLLAARGMAMPAVYERGTGRVPGDDVGIGIG